MSYILDALKKAERDRHLTKVPTLQTVHRTSWQPRRTHWLWIAVAVGAVNVGLLIWLLRPEPAREKVAQAPAAATAPHVEKPAPPPMQEPLAPASAPEKIAPAVEPAPAARVPAPPPAPEARPATVTKQAELAPRPTVAPTPVAPKMETAKPTEAVKPRSASPPAPTPEAPVVAAVPGRSVAPPAPSAPATPSGTARGGQAPTLQDMTAAQQEGIPKLTLQFLVYSDAPQDRLVFINNQKYLEGQSVDGKFLVEAIQPDGVTLSYQGKRFTLRQ